MQGLKSLTSKHLGSLTEFLTAWHLFTQYGIVTLPSPDPAIDLITLSGLGIEVKSHRKGDTWALGERQVLALQEGRLNVVVFWDWGIVPPNISIVPLEGIREAIKSKAPYRNFGGPECNHDRHFPVRYAAKWRNRWDIIVELNNKLP